MKRAFLLALVAIVTLATLSPAGAAAAAPQADSPVQPAVSAAVQDTTNGTDSGGENATNASNSTGSNPNETTAEPNPDAPDAAEMVRVTPIDYGEDFLGVETADSDTEFETRGPFATFTASEEIDAVRIEQSAASATLLEGDRTIHVDYEDDAAPNENQSYYALELFFVDGSDTTVDLYAAETDVSVEAAKLSEYSGLISDMEEDAEAEGYDADPDGVASYYSWTQDRIELLDNLLAQRAAELFGLAIAAAMNPLVWILGLGALAILAYKRESQHGWILDRIENDVSETDRKQSQLVTSYEQAAVTADEEPLTDLDAIGPQQAAFWKDSFGVTSVRQLAELARRGRQVRADGGNLEQPHDGVESLSAENLEGSWLEPILRSHRLSTSREALSHLRAAVIRMDSKHGMGHRYRDTRAAIEELLAETNPNGSAGAGR